VILGGGRKEFRPKSVTDEDGAPGSRTDGVDLIENWKIDKSNRNVSFKYMWSRDQLLSTDPATADYVLGEYLSEYPSLSLQIQI
jgi:alkaline phosphatase